MDSIFGTEITLHVTTDSGGNSLEYARIVRRSPGQVLGQCVMLHRLSPEQRKNANSAAVAQRHSQASVVAVVTLA